MRFLRRASLVVAILSMLVGSTTLLAARLPSNQSPTTLATTKHPQFPSVAESLARLYADYDAHLSAGAAPASFTPNDSYMRVRDGMVWVEAIAQDNPAALLSRLEALGLEQGNWVNFLIGGWLPIKALPRVGALADLQFVRPAYAISNVGLVTSQADSAMRAQQARSSFGIDGSGITVGTLSDSYDCAFGDATSAAQDVASGDIPAGVVVLQELDDTGCIDEGRAMMQLIHDLAPGATQQFHSAFLGVADFAQGIRDLAAAGSDVIVDDVIYFAEPMFQDGPIAQAANDVYAQGVPYFSSAGNNGRDAYESVFRPGPQVSFDVGDESITYTPHDFDPGPGVDVYQQMVLEPFARVFLALQWDQPFASVSGPPGTQNNIDIVAIDASGTGGVIDTNNEIGGDAVILFEFFNFSASPSTYDILIGTRSGANPGYFKYVLFDAPTSIEYATNSGTVYGHANAANAAAVGAAGYLETPAFGTNPAVQQSYSSAGTTPIFFNVDGSRKASVEVRPKPEFTAVDETDTTFFIAGNDPDNNGFPNFNGTSAAAPHAAAAAALLLERDPTLTPQEIYNLLAESALDMAAPGFDNDTGAGLIQVDAALAALGTFDLRLSKQVEPVSIVSRPITYTLMVDNIGSLNASNVVLTDTLAGGVNFISARIEGGTCARNGSNVICQLPQLAVETSAEATIVVSRATPGVLSNTATVGVPNDSTPANNVATASTTLYNANQVADLRLGLAAVPLEIEPSDALTLTFDVANTGLASATPVTVTLNLPTDVEVASAAGTGWSCSPTTGVVRCSRATLALGSAPTITVSIIAPAAVGRLDFTATVASNTPDPVSANNMRTVIVSSGLQLYLPLVRR
ncbi:S8 family serine peptidase [Candidatus Gracilibacteria bacterium]|nr:S8 family serine peptidase [Candidatus Gracilibacteria bacterium]